MSDWLEVDQKRINQFADATEDHQWIHVDAERARRESPTKATIAHGYLTLSLIAGLIDKTIQAPDIKQVINYGLNKVRFPSPVPVGSRLRARFTLKNCEWISETAAQLTWAVTVEREGQEKPACAAEILFRYFI